MATIIVEGLSVPDFRPCFPQVTWRPMPHSMGIPVGSDWSDKAAADPTYGLYKNCGFWTMAEAAILYNVAHCRPGSWLDIGAHTGWTAAHIGAAHASNKVLAIDPLLGRKEFRQRLFENLSHCSQELHVVPYAGTSNLFFTRFASRRMRSRFSGVVIDGDHDAPHPLEDARNATDVLTDDGVVLFHDAIGGPVQDAVDFLISIGFRYRLYLTPHVVAVCWRGGHFEQPLHVPNPSVQAALLKIPWIHDVTSERGFV